VAVGLNAIPEDTPQKPDTGISDGASRIKASKVLELAASGHAESADWYFLFGPADEESSDVSKRRVFVSNTVSVEEDKNSTIVVLKQGQAQLFRLEAEGGFKKDTVLEFQSSLLCNVSLFLGYDAVPRVPSLLENKSVFPDRVVREMNGTRNFVQIQKTSSVLYGVFAAMGDCTGFSFSFRKTILPVRRIVPGELIYLSKAPFTSLFSIHEVFNPELRLFCSTASTITGTISTRNFLYDTLDLPRWSDGIGTMISFYRRDISDDSPWFISLTVPSNRDYVVCQISVKEVPLLLPNATVVQTRPPGDSQSYEVGYRLQNPGPDKVLCFAPDAPNTVGLSSSIPAKRLLLFEPIRICFFNVDPEDSVSHRGDILIQVRYSFNGCTSQAKFTINSYPKVELLPGRSTQVDFLESPVYMLYSKFGGVMNLTGDCKPESSSLLLSTHDSSQIIYTPFPESGAILSVKNTTSKCQMKLDPTPMQFVTLDSFESKPTFFTDCVNSLDDGPYCLSVVSITFPQNVSGLFASFSHPVGRSFGSTTVPGDFQILSNFYENAYGPFPGAKPNFIGGTEAMLLLSETSFRAHFITSDEVLLSGGGSYLTVPSLNEKSSRFFLMVLRQKNNPGLTVKFSAFESFIQSSQKFEDQLMLPESPLPRMFTFPVSEGKNIVAVKLTNVSTSLVSTTQLGWFFGANVLEQTLTNQSQSFYSSNSKSEARQFLLFVSPAAASATLLVEFEPIRFLCNPILGCSGNGNCPDSRLEPTCECLQGIAFGFSGNSCGQKSSKGALVLSFSVISILLALVLITWIILTYVKRRNMNQSKDADRLKEPLNEGEEFDVESESKALADATSGNLVELRPSVSLEGFREFIQPCSISVENLSLVTEHKNKKPGVSLLKNINLQFKAGTFTAIMGPSGSGKSTLLKVLSGKFSHTSGNLLFNGKPSDRDLLGKVLGYVPQEDILHPTLTVKEHIVHSARTRLPRSISEQQTLLICDFIIQSLGLEKRKDFLVGDIGQSALSGGQRRRLSIGMELSVTPSILFLDEPTSGLDSQASLALVQLLREKIVDGLGINAIAVLHQPRTEILELCDQIVLLKDGEIRYHGPPSMESLAPVFPPLRELQRASVSNSRFFNIGDLIIDEIDTFEKKEKTLEVYSGPRTGLENRNSSSVIRQLQLQLRRSWIQLLRSYTLLTTLFGLTAVVAFMLGMMFADSAFVGSPTQEIVTTSCIPEFYGACSVHKEDNYLTQMSMIALSVGLVAISSSLLTFGGIERRNFARESTWGQNSFVYYFAKELVSIPNLLLAPFLFVSIFQTITAPPIDFITLWMILFGIYFSASGTGHLISVICPESRTLIVSVVYVALMSSLSGVQPSLSALRKSFGPILGKLLPSLSFIRWSVESFYVSVLWTYKGIYNVQLALDVQEYSFDDFSATLVYPIVIGLVFRILTFLVIWKHSKGKFSL
jgi:ABC-type multidrug transport system ATPase subunit